MDSKTNEKKHVLVISGDPQILAEIKMEIMPFFSVSMSAASSSALNILEAYMISAIVICIGKNSAKAFSDFSEIFDLAKTKRIPMMFIAEVFNDADETRAFAVGAVDYSARRQGTVDAFVERINLRINANEHEKSILSGENVSPTPDEISVEESLKGKTFLVVDDVSLNRELIKAMLSGINGLTVDEAGDGKEAVRMFKEDLEKYALIFMDIQMPVMDGFEATIAIRQFDIDYAKKVPIIALTAASLESEVKKCQEAGMTDFLVKPMSYDDLVFMASEYVSLKES